MSYAIPNALALAVIALPILLVGVFLLTIPRNVFRSAVFALVGLFLVYGGAWALVSRLTNSSAGAPGKAYCALSYDFELEQLTLDCAGDMAGLWVRVACVFLFALSGSAAVLWTLRATLLRVWPS